MTTESKYAGLDRDSMHWNLLQADVKIAKLELDLVATQHRLEALNQAYERLEDKYYDATQNHD